MLDPKTLRTQPELVLRALKNRNSKLNLDEFNTLDTRRRQLLFEVEGMKSRQNVVSKDVPRLKQAGEDVSAVFAEMKELSRKISEMDTEVREIDVKLDALLLLIPNIPHDSVPVGADENDNVEIRRWGNPREFSFDPKPHWDIGEALDILDFKNAAKITGARFTLYKGLGARLERAVMNFYLDTHVDQNGYTEVITPLMLNRASMTGTGQLPKFEEDSFKIADTDYFLSPTEEVPLTNIHRDEIIDGARLPIYYTASSTSFRAGAGSAGRDTRGLIRQHQFNNVELVKFATPQTSFDELEKMSLDAEGVLKMLGLPHRVVLLCTGDMGFSSTKTYDLEVWMPSYGRYVEISSCSNCMDFQARRAAIKYRANAGGKAEFVHTLNGTGVSITRTIAAILENYQNEDGSITIPDVLKGYMGRSGASQESGVRS